MKNVVLACTLGVLITTMISLTLLAVFRPSKTAACYAPDVIIERLEPETFQQSLNQTGYALDI